MDARTSYTSRELLIQSLPEWKRIFIKTQTFKTLEKAFDDWLECKEDFQEKKEVLKLAYENFLHLCDSDPSGEKEKYLQKLEREKREEILHQLYLQHKEQMV